MKDIVWPAGQGAAALLAAPHASSRPLGYFERVRSLTGEGCERRERGERGERGGRCERCGRYERYERCGRYERCERHFQHTGLPWRAPPQAPGWQPRPRLPFIFMPVKTENEFLPSAILSVHVHRHVVYPRCARWKYVYLCCLSNYRVD